MWDGRKIGEREFVDQRVSRWNDERGRPVHGLYGAARRRGARAPPAAGSEGAPPANPIHLPPRSVLRQHYVLGRVLGHGGFGIAYLAWDPDLQMKVAVKEFLPGDVATRGRRRRQRDALQRRVARAFDTG